MVVPFVQLRRGTETALVRPGTARILAGDDDVEFAGAVDSLDAFEFDVAGGARAADHGQGPGAVDPAQRFGQDPRYVGGFHDADVVVRDEGDRAAALVGAAVQDDGSRSKEYAP